MLSALQGRLARRYIAIVAFACLGLFLWHNFETSISESFSSTAATSSTGPKIIDSFKLVPSSYDWSQARIFHPVEQIKTLPTGWLKTFPRVQARSTSAILKDDISAKRRQIVKSKFLKSWEAYKTHAWTKDELMPLSGKGKQTLSGWSAQLVDAMDTLWIMDLKQEFRRAMKEMAVVDWAKPADPRIDLPEVSARYLGGIISAYELSSEPALLAKATELGDTLYTALDTPNRLPPRWLVYDTVRRGEQQAEAAMPGAAAASLCLEFTRLSQLTGDPRYYDAADRIKQFFHAVQGDTMIPGLWPRDLNYRDETAPGAQFSLGPSSHSLYEHLPKMDALLGGLDPEYPQMTTQALDAVIKNMLFRPKTPKSTEVLLVGSVIIKDGVPVLTANAEHQTCYAGGMFGLAGKLLERNDYVDIGSRLANGCLWAHDSFSTNIMPEVSQVMPCNSLEGPCHVDGESLRPRTILQNRARTPLADGFVGITSAKYLLRPEAIETIFYMWRITGDHAWRDAAWRIWEGIMKETETEMAFASIEDSTTHLSTKLDSMQGFWMGSTLKYFYLIFDDESNISLDEWVLSTAAHPFRRPK